MDITKYNINYKTFDQLFDEIEEDLETIDVSRDKYIKVAQTCNSKLGLKIYPEKETVVEIVNGVGKLPDDFKLFDFAFICARTKTVQIGLDQSYTEYNTDIPVFPYESIKKGCNTCSTSSFVCDSYNLHCTPYQVWKKNKTEFINIYEFAPITILPTSLTHCQSSSCPNIYEKTKFFFNIVKEKDCFYIKTNLEDTQIYIRYTADMVDEDNNLLILDNQIVAPYYEYSIKKKIFEDLWLNGDDSAQNRLQMMMQEYRIAKRDAENFVNMPDFETLKSIYKWNRKRQYDKYIHPINDNG